MLPLVLPGPKLTTASVASGHEPTLVSCLIIQGVKSKDTKSAHTASKKIASCVTEAEMSSQVMDHMHAVIRILETNWKGVSLSHDPESGVNGR